MLYSGLLLLFLLLSACGRGPHNAQLPRQPANDAPEARGAQSKPPSMWFGVRFESRRITLTVAKGNADPQPLVTEPPSRRSEESLEVTDLAYDTQRAYVYIGTCCEPGSGHLVHVDTKASRLEIVPDDQGFAVDAGGRPGIRVRTDTWGTLVIRTADDVQHVSEATAAADVAVAASGPTRVFALIDSRRLRALVPTVPAASAGLPDPGLLIRRRDDSGRWVDASFPLRDNSTYCRVVPLPGDAVGLLAGTFDPRDPLLCTGDTLDVLDIANGQLQTNVLTFPAAVRHISTDDSSTFLIFTTVDGAVGWRTLDGRGGTLAASGFTAADW